MTEQPTEPKPAQQPQQPQSQPSATNQSPSNINVNILGYFLDGWADLIEGMGAKADEVRSTVIQGLKDRGMPEINISKKNGYVSLTTSEKRVFGLAETSPGATTTIYIAQHGKDLYASWRTFIRPVFNQPLILAALVICLSLGLFVGGWKDDFYGGTSFSFSGWMGWTIGFVILAAIVLAFAGRVLKGNTLAFFFVEPNIFDAEDITAMSLSVHKSILRSLDGAGIDISKLRLKGNFKGGRRGEDV